MFRCKHIILALLMAAFAAGMIANAQQILTPAQAKGKKILLVVGEPEKGETNDDDAVKKHFESLGYVVTLSLIHILSSAVRRSWWS